MRVALLLVALAIAAAAAQGRELEAVDKILNGRDDPELGLFDKGRFPYVVQMRYPWADDDGPGKGTFICAGTLVQPDIVLTSAWCAMNAGLLPEIRINSWDTDGKPGTYEPRRVVGVDIHGNWTGQQTNRLAEDNLAIMLLDSPAYTKPIGFLPPAVPSPAVPIGTKMSILGWGSIKSYAGPLAENLRGGSQLLLTQQRCHEKWSRERPPVINPGTWSSMKVICAAYAGHNKALCRGDQGGPMVRRGKDPTGDMLVGIGVMTNCGGFGDLGGSVYLNVPFYQGWIRSGIALLRRRSLSSGAHRMVYTKDVTPGGFCGSLIGYPCAQNSDCCTRQCDVQYQRCWF